jgi:type IV pilus assembly protein PilO
MTNQTSITLARAPDLSAHLALCRVRRAAGAGTIVLAVRLGLDWAATNGRSTDVLAGKQVELKAMDLQTAPLRGLDKRVAEVREQIKLSMPSASRPTTPRFLRIGELEVKSGVRCPVQYTQGPPGADLTEISLDAGISGTYPQIMRFVNSLERDQTSL